MMYKGLARLLLSAGALISTVAAAQTIDSVEWVDGGAQPVLRIKFTGNVHFVRQAPAAGVATDLAQISFQMVTIDQKTLPQQVQESRHLDASAGLPQVDLSYDPRPADPVATLTLRLGEREVVQARQGRTAQIIELVLTKPAPDAGTAAATAAPPAPDASAPAVPAPMPSAQGAAAVQAAVATVAATEPQVVQQGKEALENGRQALNEKRYQDAADLFNKGLLLPPNPSSQETQELIGLAWEGLNLPQKARQEYQLYLKLYPQGDGAQRVQRRLDSLNLTTAAQPAATPAARPVRSRYSATGSVSQFYYGGNTQTETLVNIASGIDQNTLTQSTQSVLVSSWDATGRYEGDGSETRIVMRGSHSDNLSSNSTTTSATQGLVSAAYVDYRDLKSGLSVRAGRQSAIGGAMFGLFDGVSAAMPVGANYKLDAMAGVPANTLINAPQQTLLGTMLEADNLFTHWGGDISLVQQTTEGIVDRRAVGLDARYFGDDLSLFSQIDYDINVNVLNAVTVQGSVQGPWDTTITMMLDDRKAPSFQVSDALIGSNYTSLAQMVADMGLATVQSTALQTTAEAKQAMLSFSRALAPKWQGSMDLRYSDVSALPAIGNFQATPATGAQYNVSFQLTGSNLYSKHDINGFNVSFLTSDLVQGTQLAYNNLTGMWGDKGTLEPSIRYYTQTDNTDTRVTRISPGLRASYKLNRKASLTGEMIYESSQTSGPTNNETSTSVYFYFGYRYDFQ